jgi:endoglucanase
MKKFRRMRQFLGVSIILVVLLATVPMLALANSNDDEPGIDPGTEFYVAKRNQGAIMQIADLTSNGDKTTADHIREMIDTPQSVWIEAGDPHQTQQSVKNTVQRAAGKGTVPVLVAYNIPFRDCAQFSAGGATTVEEYTAWIDGFVAGIGDHEVVVILEPDGLGIIPWYTNIDGSLEWCQPAEANPETAAAERFYMLNYAVDAFKAQPNTHVYLDGTHSGWLNVGDAADRLFKAGVQRADGFFLNVSNYQFRANQVQYGTWISKCLTFTDFSGCANQYWNGGPDGTKIADLLGPWSGVALSNYGEWSDDSDDPALNTSGINWRYGDAQPTTHFVIDTSRNGVGPWDPSSAGYPDPQDWCNPPDRGLGFVPTADTGVPSLDAYLWVKIPGESDGECTRGLGPAGETIDPVWSIIDPPAGKWFPEMVLDLVQFANPPLE